MLKKICFRFQEKPEKFLMAKIQNGKLLFKHITVHTDYFENVEDVKKNYIEFFEEDDKVWQDLILSIKLHSDLKEKLFNFNSEKILVEFNQFGKEITAVE